MSAKVFVNDVEQKGVIHLTLNASGNYSIQEVSLSPAVQGEQNQPAAAKVVTLPKPPGAPLPGQ